jgi:hypothetical protein
MNRIRLTTERMPAPAAAEASESVVRICSRDSCDAPRKPCDPMTSSSPPTSSRCSGGIVESTIRAPWSAPTSVPVRAQKPSGSSGRAILGTTVSHSARSTWSWLSERMSVTVAVLLRVDDPDGTAVGCGSVTVRRSVGPPGPFQHPQCK